MTGLSTRCEVRPEDRARQALEAYARVLLDGANEPAEAAVPARPAEGCVAVATDGSSDEVLVALLCDLRHYALQIGCDHSVLDARASARFVREQVTRL